MATHFFTSREFNQDTASAKRAAQEGPVFITDRGKPSHVLLSIEEYRRLAGEQSRLDLGVALWMPGADEIEFEIPRLPWPIRPVSFD